MVEEKQQQVQGRPANESDLLMSPVKSRGLSIMNALTILGGVLLAVLSIWPGCALGCFVVILLIPAIVMGLGWVVALIEFAQAEKAGKRKQNRQLFVIPAAVCATLIVLKMHLMQAAVFATVRSSFDRLLSSAPIVNLEKSSRGPKVIDRWIGPYHLIEYAADARGGVYFVTGRSGDGLGPDMTSYGFVYQPNSQGSPFGRKYYNPVHLFGDWYMFEASDDF